MGIFSFLGKKDRRDDETTPSQADAPRRRRDDQTDRSDNAARSERIANSQIVQRDAARKTALKIDAIESEMSSELSRPPNRAKSGATNSAIAARKFGGNAPAALSGDDGNTAISTEHFSATLPVMGMATDFLLGADATTKKDRTATTEIPAVIEEAAILFANDQNDLVESILLGAIHDDALGSAVRVTWWMLFDFYQISGKQIEFDNLALGYASKFETSPPTWVTPCADNGSGGMSGSNTAVVFSGNLDESISKQIDRALKISAASPALYFEFARVASANTDGCTLLLAGIKKLKQQGCDLSVNGANELLKSIRSIIEVGRRDASEAPWLLLLEILQLMNRQQDFEEASIDYCVTFEVSPPAFIAPKSTVTAAAENYTEEALPDNVLMMPTIVDSKSNLVETITKFVQQHNPAILDCSRLTRVDFSAASQLLAGLAPLTSDDRVVELNNVNHLVHALFNVIGLREVAQISPRKQ